jgi:hypothetical protein
MVKVTKTQRPIERLGQVLRDGPVPQKEIEARAKNDKIGIKPLKLAKARLKVQSTRKNRAAWAWVLFDRNPPRARVEPSADRLALPAGIEVPRVNVPSLERGSGLMTKADFLDFTYVGGCAGLPRDYAGLPRCRNRMVAGQRVAPLSYRQPSPGSAKPGSTERRFDGCRLHQDVCREDHRRQVGQGAAFPGGCRTQTGRRGIATVEGPVRKPNLSNLRLTGD